MLLTDAQLQEILTIIRNAHEGFVINAVRPAIEDSYVYGQLLEQLNNPEVQKMSYEEFKSWVEQNPIPLTPVEQAAIRSAKYRAGQFCQGLGNKVGARFNQALIEADAGLRAMMRDEIRSKTAEATARRQTAQKLKSNLGWATSDWSRDWMRIANTELHEAHQTGVKDQIAKRYGSDALVFKRSMPDACFRAGTEIVTERGNVPIECIKVGDLVLTHRLQWRRVTALMQRDYDGRIYGFNDRSPSMTDNHPVLSDLDWCRADSVKRGSYLGKVAVTHVPQNNSSVRLKYPLFTNISSTDASTSVPVSSVQFDRYLQVRDSDIDVEFVDSHFRNGREICEQLDQMQSFRGDAREIFLSCLSFPALSSWGACLFLSFACVVRQLLTFFLGHSVEVGRLAFGSAGKFDSGFNQATAYYSGTDFEVRGDRSDRVFAGFQKRRNLPDSNGCSFLNHPVLVTTQVEKVNTVATEHFKGVVYNLEVEGDHSYVADGLIVHNCEMCKKLYLGSDNHPIIFKLEDLEANGTNVGRKQAQWLPVVGATHPHCHPPGTRVVTLRGEVSIEHVCPGDLVLTQQLRWRRVTHTWSSFYEGMLVGFKAGDRQLWATPNHELMTSDGWESVLSQDDSGEVVDSLEGKSLFSLLDPDSMQFPTTSFERRSFATVLFGFSGGGVPITAIDFDGKLYIREGEVDQEHAKGKSDFCDNAMRTESIVDHAFVGRFELTSLGLRYLSADGDGSRTVSFGAMSSGSEPLTFRLAESAEAEGIRFCLSAWDVPGVQNPFLDCSTGDSKIPRYCLHRKQLVEVHIDNAGNIEFAPKRTVPISHAEFSSDYVSIAGVSLTHYKGVVHNLTVDEDESYFAEGIASHNCQCQLVRIPAGWGFDEEGRMVPGGEFGEFAKSMSAWRVSFDKRMELRKALIGGGHVEFQKLPIFVENPAGSVRRWRDQQGNEGETRMLYAYGEILGTEGADGDPIDVFLGPDHRAKMVYVVHQQDPEGGRYDEDKCMLGFSSEQAAISAYRAHYNKPGFDVACTPMEMDHFKRWARLSNPSVMSLSKQGPRLVVPFQKALVSGRVSAHQGAWHSPAGKRAPAPGGSLGVNYAFPVPQREQPDLSNRGSLRPTLEEAKAKPDRGIYRAKETYWINEKRGIEAKPVELNRDMEIFEGDYVDAEYNRQKLDEEAKRRQLKLTPNRAPIDKPTKSKPKDEDAADDDTIEPVRTPESKETGTS
jgi:hypothetical protein